MNLIEILSILGIHWLADFVLQTDKQSKGKSKNWSDLISHTYTYSMVWLAFGLFVILLNIHSPFLLYKEWTLTMFVLITFICHTLTDYVTSRLNRNLWEQNKTHLFFVSIGFDQILHYFQLFVTYQYLIK